MVMMGWIAVAGTAGWMGVLHCTQQIHCSRRFLSIEVNYCSFSFHTEAIGAGHLLWAQRG
jgi:hypothetical protein